MWHEFDLFVLIKWVDLYKNCAHSKFGNSNVKCLMFKSDFVNSHEYIE